MSKNVSFTICLAILLGACFALDTNPLSAFLDTDSSIFIYIAREMHNGACPYRDIFDHKGPLLYFINYIGLFLGVFGVWAIESFLIITSGLYTFQYTSKRFGITAATVSVIVSTPLLTFAGQGGNFTETYAYCISLYSLIALCKDIDNGNMRTFHCAIHGICAVALLLLRPNLAVVPVVIATAYVVESARRRSLKDFIRWTTISLIAAIVTFVPFALYLSCNNLWHDCYQVYIRFNLEYASIHRGTAHWALYACIAIFIIYLAAYRLTNNSNRRLYTYGLFLMALALGVTVANPRYLHYYCIFIPPIVLTTAVAIQSIETLATSAIRPIFILCAGLILLECAEITMTCAVVGHYIGDSIVNKKLQNPLEYICYDRGGLKQLDSLKPHITDLNSLTVIGNTCAVYLYLNAKTPQRHPFQTPTIYCNESIKKEVVLSIQSKTAKYLITKDSGVNILMPTIANNYDAVCESGRFTLWQAKQHIK